MGTEAREITESDKHGDTEITEGIQVGNIPNPTP